MPASVPALPTCAGYVRRLTRLSIPRGAGRSSEDQGFWVTLYWLLSSSGHEHRHHDRVSAGATAR